MATTTLTFPIVVILFFLSLLSASVALNEKCESTATFALGSFTENRSYPSLHGEGVSLLTFNALAGPFETVRHPPAFSGPNPNYITRVDDTLYIVNAVSDPVLGGLTSIRYGSTSPFISHSHISFHGHPAHVEAVRNASILLVSNMASGSIRSFQISTNPPAMSVADEFTVTDQPDQIHGAFALSGHSSTSVIATGFVSNRLYILDVSSHGALTLRQVMQLLPGDRPRHAVVHPTSGVIFVNCAFSRTIVTVTPDTSGSFHVTSRMPIIPPWTTLPPGPASAIRLSPDNRFLYVAITAGRSHYGAIAVFEVSSSGSLSGPIGVWSSHGIHPHDFYVSSPIAQHSATEDCVHYIVIPNMLSDNLVFLRRDPSTGIIASTPDFVYHAPAVASVVQI